MLINDIFIKRKDIEKKLLEVAISKNGFACNVIPIIDKIDEVNDVDVFNDEFSDVEILKNNKTLIKEAYGDKIEATMLFVENDISFGYDVNQYDTKGSFFYAFIKCEIDIIENSIIEIENYTRYKVKTKESLNFISDIKKYKIVRI